MYCYRKKKEKDRDREREDENEEKEEEMKFDLDSLRDLFQKARELVILILHNEASITKHNEAQRRFFLKCVILTVHRLNYVFALQW